MEFLCPIGFVLFFLALGFFVGSNVERSHFRDLERREALHRDFLVTQVDHFPFRQRGAKPPVIVMADTVIACDYLKAFLASWRNLFGGEVRSYNRMMERARRESILRLIEAAKQQGYNAICNVRLETADIGGSAASPQNNRPAMAAIQATATAYVAGMPSS